MHRPGSLAAIAAFVLCSDAATAEAGNEDELPVGNHAAMTGGAVTATVRDGSAVFYNPAGLGAVERSTIDVSASAYSLRHYVARDFIGLVGGPSRDAKVTELVTIPTQIAYVRELGRDLKLGLGYFVPRASNLLLSERVVADTADSTATFALDTNVREAHYVLGASVGSRAGRSVRWGAGLLASYVDRTESASIFSAVERGGMGEQSLQLAALGTWTQLGAELGAGVQLDLGAGVTLAAAARSPGLQLSRSSDESVNGAITSLEADADPSLTVLSEPIAERDDGVAQVDAGRYTLALAWSPSRGRGTLAVEADVQPGFHSERTGVDRQLTWNARAGYSLVVSPAVRLGAGAFTDRATEPLDTDGLIGSRIDFYGATVGVELTSDHALARDEPVETLALSTTFALRYAYGDGTTQVLNVDPEAPAATLFTPGQRPIHVHEVGLHVGSALYF